jgi:DNA polymerase
MWDHPTPVFLDFETQSSCDLKAYGSRKYARHPSTRILIMAVTDGVTYHVWIPRAITRTPPKAGFLWPHQLKPSKPVTVYNDETCPQAIVDLCEGAPVVAHNAYGFDKLIADALLPSIRITWLDSIYAARACGRIGALDRLAKQVAGQGKDRAKKLLKELTTATISADGKAYVYPIIRPGDLQAFTTYAIADVELVASGLWPTFDDLTIEAEHIEVHNRANDRGIAVDTTLLKVIEKLSQHSQGKAMEMIREITDGAIDEHNIRSTKQIHEWLASFGVDIVDPDTGKPCLRKEIVQRYVDSPYILGGTDDRGDKIESALVAVREIPPAVIEVLKLRMKALRITDAKVSRALDRVEFDGRIRGLKTYHVAHTGRNSSAGVQTDNLPRPHPALMAKRELSNLDYPVKSAPTVLEHVLDYIESNPCDRVEDTYDDILMMLPTRTNDIDVPRLANMDDVCSALLRLSFVAGKDKLFCIADYAAIEARCVAWMADEEKLLQSFRSGVDIYREFASYLYGIPVSAVSSEQRQIGKVVILGAGYSMSANKFRIYAANQGIDLTKAGISAEDCIEKYRDSYPMICGWKPDKTKSFRLNGLWQKLDKAVKDAVGKRSTEIAGKCTYFMRRDDLICVLPSGREMWYPEARIEDIVPPYVYTYNLPPNPKATVTYQGHYSRKSIYGGLATENASQAICRDIMIEAKTELDGADICPVLDVHDEIISEVDSTLASSSLRQMVQIMSRAPEWAPGFPVTCEGFVSPRWTKKVFKGWEELSTKNL